jgi:hypothetical protein
MVETIPLPVKWLYLKLIALFIQVEAWRQWRHFYYDYGSDILLKRLQTILFSFFLDDL